MCPVPLARGAVIHGQLGQPALARVFLDDPLAALHGGHAVPVRVLANPADHEGGGAEDADSGIVGVLALLDHGDEAAERLADAREHRPGQRRDAVDQRAVADPFPDLPVNLVGDVRLHLEADEVAVGRPAAVTAAEVIRGDEDDPPLGQVGGLAVPVAPGRLKIPVPPVVRPARDGQDDDRALGDRFRVGHDGGRQHGPLGRARRQRRGDVEGQVLPDQGHVGPPAGSCAS